MSNPLSSSLPHPPPSPNGPSRAHAPGRSQWSWRLGTLAHIPVYVHATFVALLAWIVLSHVMRGDGAGGALSGLLLTLSLFACVVLHELSHALVARHFGIRTRDITLLPIGGVARLERMPESPRQELLVALAGPAASFAIAASLFALSALAGSPTSVEGLHVVGGPFLAKLLWLNLGLGAFNLLPAFPMDGGRALRAALAMWMDRDLATGIAARIGQGMALLFGAVGFFVNPLLVVVAIFVWMGATGEASLVQLQSALRGLPVSQAMITDFRTLAPHDTLSCAVELTLAGFQQDFPVLDGERIVGVLTYADVLKGLAVDGAQTPVMRAMHQAFETATPSEMLEVAFERLGRCECAALVVVHGGRVVGMLTPENIGEMLMMKKALRVSQVGP